MHVLRRGPHCLTSFPVQMTSGHILTLMLCISVVVTLPLQDAVPHNKMQGITPRAGTDARHPHVDTVGSE